MAHRVLGHLDQDGVAGLQRVLDAALLAFEVDGFPVHFTGVQHGVAAASDVDEGGFHGGQHVLDLAQVDVADQGVLLGLGDEVLGQDAVFEDADLDSVVALADDHLPVHGFAAGQELGFGDDGAAAAGVAGFAAALLLGFQPGGTLDAGHPVVDRCLADGARCADAGNGVGRIVVVPRRSVRGPGHRGGGGGDGGTSRLLPPHRFLPRPIRQRRHPPRSLRFRRPRGRPAGCDRGGRGCGAGGGRCFLGFVVLVVVFVLALFRCGGRCGADDGAQVRCLEQHGGGRGGLEEQGGERARFLVSCGDLGRRRSGFSCWRGSCRAVGLRGLCCSFPGGGFLCRGLGCSSTAASRASAPWSAVSLSSAAAVTGSSCAGAASAAAFGSGLRRGSVLRVATRRRRTGLVSAVSAGTSTAAVASAAVAASAGAASAAAADSAGAASAAKAGSGSAASAFFLARGRRAAALAGTASASALRRGRRASGTFADTSERGLRRLRLRRHRPSALPCAGSGWPSWVRPAASTAAASTSLTAKTLFIIHMWQHSCP